MKTVYWTCLEDEWMRSLDPEPVDKKSISFNVDQSDLSPKSCPAVNDYLKNVFSIKSIYSYNLTVEEDGSCRSNMHDQKFFNEHINIRSSTEKLISFKQRFLFFTNDDSLEMSIEHPFLEENNLTESSIVMPGKFDIGKWLRSIDFGIKIKNGHKSFSIEEGQTIYYIRFNTDEKIRFVKFYPTKKIKDMVNSVEMSRMYGKRVGILGHYRRMSFKNLILKEIRSSLLI